MMQRRDSSYFQRRLAEIKGAPRARPTSTRERWLERIRSEREGRGHQFELALPVVEAKA